MSDQTASAADSGPDVAEPATGRRTWPLVAVAAGGAVGIGLLVLRRRRASGPVSPAAGSGAASLLSDGTLVDRLASLGDVLAGRQEAVANEAYLGTAGYGTATGSNGVTRVVFGDGVAGARPAVGSGSVDRAYRTGLGSSGDRVPCRPT